MKQSAPLTRDLVLIGGGHTHALVLHAWAMSPLAGVRLTLINPGPGAAYSGMLPGFVAGHYTRDELDIDLVRLARMAGARLILGAATEIDVAARRVTVPGRPDVAFDACSIDIGITSDMPALPGFSDHAVSAKPLDRFARSWSEFLSRDTDAPIAVIGGGVAGSELALALSHGRAALGWSAPVTIIDRGKIAKELGFKARNVLLAELDRFGIIRTEGAEVRAIEEGAVLLKDGSRVEAGLVVGAAGARPYDWLAETGLETTDGFLDVGPTLQTSDPVIFAAGDCAHLTFDPRPKAGVYAVREAPILTHNLKAVLSGKPLRRYAPQRDYLKLVSLGGKRALAEKFGMVFSGAAMWHWKDRIDRKFMDQFEILAPMAPEVPMNRALGVDDVLGGGPPCGGCGSKAGRGALQASLGASVGDDAAVLETGGVRQVVSTDHLRAMTDDPFTMAQIAAVHAMGDVWAMGATPQSALATIILPRMSADLQARTMNEIMAGARAALEQTPIIGGHTSLGDELTIGFTVTGICETDPITLAGARAGDVLILTKAIGSGTIFAAEMRGEAGREDVASALQQLTAGQGAAARILSGATAMTDVTGFGLAGHLMNLCEGSGVAVELSCDDVPLMLGAAALCAKGVRSSLFAQNRADLPDIDLPDLMFDPQTAGGLLAAVPEPEADALVSELRAAGYKDAARIGRVTDGPPAINRARPI